MKTIPTVSLPQGVRDILPEEAEKIGSVESAILKVFKRNGFERVITPILEYLDVLLLGVGENLKDRVIKFIDPSTGRVVGIRPDITPQIARVVATRMRDYPLPLKLSYSASVIRYEEPRRGKASEVLQVGAEYITKESSPKTDAEMILMAIEALDAAGLRDFKIDIGDVSFLKTVLDSLRISDEEKRSIKGAVAIKDSKGLGVILDGLGKRIRKEDAHLLLSLTTLYGEAEVFRKAAGFSKNPAAQKALSNLKKVYEIVKRKGFADLVTVDLGEVRGFDYYTGIIFEGFAKGLGKPVLTGGRYDTLLMKYGYASAATGLAFDVENIASAV